MQYKELYYLLTLQKEGLLSNAAAQLELSQSSLSLFLQRLEKKLDIRLYDRKKHTMTEAGNIFCSGAAKILTLHERAAEEIRQLTATEVVYLGLDMHFFECFPEVVSEIKDDFGYKYPNIEVHIYLLDENDIRDLLLHGKLDVAYSYFSETPLNICREAVISENMFLVVPPAKLSADDTPLQLLRKMKYIAFGRSSSIGRAIDATLFHYGITPNLHVEANSYHLICQLMKTDQFVTILPIHMKQRLGEFEFIELESSHKAVSGFYLQSKSADIPHISYLKHLIKKRIIHTYEACIDWMITE